MPRPASVEEASTASHAWLAAEQTTPHHFGHRERLRARAAAAPNALPDYELLELLLFRSLPQGDVKPLAKALLARFGGLAGVLSARPEELRTVKGIGASVSLDLKLLHEATLRIGRAEVAARPVISSWSALLGYAKAALAHEAREQFRVLFLEGNKLIYRKTAGREGDSYMFWREANGVTDVVQDSSRKSRAAAAHRDCR